MDQSIITLTVLGLLISNMKYIRRKRMDNNRVFRFEEREVANLLCRYAEIKYGIVGDTIAERTYELYKHKTPQSGDIKTGFSVTIKLKDATGVAPENTNDHDIVHRLIKMEG